MRLGRTMLAAAALLSAVTASGGRASAEGVAGSAGTDTSLPATDSALTAPGRGRFGDLRVSVNQTKGLVNQAVSVSWSGARPSTGYNQNWMQIFQCWGDDDGTNAENPGPPPEQCEFGAEPFVGNVQTKIPAGTSPSNVYTRVIANDDWSTFDASQGEHDPDTHKLWKPFRAVDGKVIGKQLTRTTVNESGVDLAWQNPYYAFATSNEDSWEKTYGEGKGTALFETYTGLEAPGLGCGQATEPQADGSKRIPKCWLVVVPRGTPEEENPSNVPTDPPHVIVSPLAASAWANRIAFPLEFNPIDSGCTIGGDQRRIVGGEIAARAVINWQPTLCAGEGTKPYAFQAIGDEQARRQVTGGAVGSAGMAIVTKPIDTAALDPDKPISYAPITLSGAVIGFNIERKPVDYNGNIVDQAEQPIAGLRVTHINLTPRLVAKLLTQSYPRQFPNIVAASPPEGYDWVKANPDHVFRDPDFLRFNPEFNLISVGSQQSAGGLIVEGATSDAAATVWRWVLADPEAKDWLAGNADQWGMKVNPFYSVTPAANPSGIAFGDPIPTTFPKSDPYCWQAPESDGVTPRPLCMLDASPLALSMEGAAQQTRAANDRSTTAHQQGNIAQNTASTWWGSDGPQATGARSILSLTDAASAARYGLQTASLSRAGDNGDDRAFTAPGQAGLLEGVKAMKAGESGVLEPDPAATAAGAYPLTMLTYAAVSPANLDDAGRADYARFITYAAGPGQTPGYKFGDLPAGYAPLPDALRDQAKTTAASVASFEPAAAPTEDAAEQAEAAQEEAVRDGVPDEESIFAPDSPMTSLTLSDLMTELTRPSSSAPQTVELARKTVPGGRTPKFVAGAIRFAVPFVFTLGGLGLLAYLLFDTARLRALVQSAASKSD